MQGVDALTSFSLPRRHGISPLMQAVGGLSEKDLKLVVGNGIHIAVFSAVVTYILSHCATRDEILERSLRRGVPLTIVDDDDDI
eukprot:11187133-Lingulodinium_polyedra.AAC.1